MTKYENELQQLKNWDEVQNTTKNINNCGYEFITTAGHGYLVIPKEDPNFNKAVNICSYGFKGNLAVYLEEDCEAGEFLELIKNN